LIALKWCTWTAKKSISYLQRTHFLFKRIFGNEKTTEPLRSLLRAILRVEVSEVKIQATELPRYNDSEKLGILDVKAVIDNGKHVNIEMQVCYQAHFMKRTQFYLSKLYDMQIGQETPTQIFVEPLL
jgi:predicted transposase/invertase (TIGR01784 family)